MDKVYIYNQQYKLAGQTVSQRDLDRKDDPDDCGDWTGYDESDLPAIGELSRTGTPANQVYWTRVAVNLREACGLK